jgi:HK97 family phage prohead protease
MSGTQENGLGRPLSLTLSQGEREPENGRRGAQGAIREVRAIEGEIRAAEGEIQGYAAVFNQVAEIWPGFREVVRPGAFARAIEEGADVRALWNHDPNYVLGRRGSGTLSIQEDEHGLRYVVKPPKAQWAEGVQETIGRGDVNQSSFAFVVRLERWTQDVENGFSLRELLDVDLIDVSPVTYPAYEGTSVGLRSAVGAREAWERHQAQGGAGQEAGDVEGAAERARSQERIAVRRRRLGLSSG